MNLTMSDSAVAQHELLISYVNAGFTRAEAMELLIAVMSASIQNQAN